MIRNRGKYFFEDVFKHAENAKQVQDAVFKKYCFLMSGPTLREIYADTGIHPTRCHRLRYGAEMRIGEFFTFRKRILEIEAEKGSEKKKDELAFRANVREEFLIKT